MKKKIVPFFVGFVIIAGIILILYPTISLRINEKHKSRVTASYTETVEKLDETGCREYREAARAYNRGLEEEHALSKATLREERDQYKTYNSLLDPCKNGVMGMVRIPKIEVYLPIYHGMGDNILQAGIGHYPGSSLPVGGEGTHCVLSGHTGHPTQQLFTDIDQLKRGDYFYLEVLGDTLAYQVKEVQIVLPERVDSLNIVPGEDLATLVTCTPYGVNSHRLLVTGMRVPYIAEAEQEAVTTNTDKRNFEMAIFGAIVFAIAIVAGRLYAILRDRKARRRRRR